jgi:hypothetical protein
MLRGSAPGLISFAAQRRFAAACLSKTATFGAAFAFGFC